MSISGKEARTAKIDWTKGAAATESEIARHALKDGTSPLSERAWQRMVRARRVKVVPPHAVDVRRIREKLALSQVEFAERFGFTASAVRQWEQGRRQPHGPARVLLTLIDREPNAVSRALLAAQ